MLVIFNDMELPLTEGAPPIRDYILNTKYVLLERRSTCTRFRLDVVYQREVV